MRWRRRRFQRLRRASRLKEFLAPHLIRVFLVMTRKTPKEMREAAKMFAAQGYIGYAVRLKEIAHSQEMEREGAS